MRSSRSTHGNDGGSQISPEVGRADPDRVVGVHVTQLFSFPSGDPSEFEGMSEEDMAAMRFLEGFTAGGGLAYNAYQSAQPQTLAYALQDSPAGWLAWVTQLFQRWVDPDYIITNAAIYWLTKTIGSSIRRYYEEAHPRTDAPTEATTTPTGVAIFAEDFQSVRRFAERDHANIVSWNHYDRGSHFSPHDAPDLLLRRRVRGCALRVGLSARLYEMIAPWAQDPCHPARSRSSSPTSKGRPVSFKSTGLPTPISSKSIGG